jgi:hypothetical protein
VRRKRNCRKGIRKRRSREKKAGKARDQKCARKNDGQGKRCEQGKRDAKENPAGTDCTKGKETAAEGTERGEKSAGRGKRCNRNRRALIKTPVGGEFCVNLCERRRQRERNCGRGKVGERMQTPAGGERCARTETAGKGTVKEGRE